MAEMEEEVSELMEESEHQLRTKISWEFIILEELRTINNLIIETGRLFSRQNIFMLKEAIDSWEQSLVPLINLPENTEPMKRVNDAIEFSLKNLMDNWSIENYTECVMRIIKKKGEIIRILAEAGKYMPISTFLFEEKKEAKIETDTGFQQFEPTN